MIAYKQTSEELHLDRPYTCARPILLHLANMLMVYLQYSLYHEQ